MQATKRRQYVVFISPGCGFISLDTVAVAMKRDFGVYPGRMPLVAFGEIRID
jgi:hypothetical protein